MNGIHGSRESPDRPRPAVAANLAPLPQERPFSGANQSPTLAPPPSDATEGLTNREEQLNGRAPVTRNVNERHIASTGYLGDTHIHECNLQIYTFRLFAQ